MFFKAIQNLLKPASRGSSAPTDPAKDLCEAVDRYRAAGDIANLLETQRSLTELFPGDVRYLAELARTLCEVDDQAEAIPLLRKALTYTPDSAKLVCELGLALAAEGALVEALSCFERCLELKPDYSAAVCALGITQNDLGNFAQAKLAFREALRLDPRESATYYNLGLSELACGDADKALGSFARCFELDFGSVWHREPVTSGRILHRADSAPASILTSPFKLRHDAEQLSYLIENHCLPGSYDEVIQAYAGVQQALPAEAPDTAMLSINGAGSETLRQAYNQPIYVPECKALAGPAINPDLDAAEIARRYRDSTPELVVVDNVLTQTALTELRRWCLESTLWFNVKDGYLGAYLWAGFSCELLMQISAEFRTRLSGIFGPHALQTLWGYKYDSVLGGIATHADSAAVNVNFWLTPDGANRDAQGGGLIVYDQQAPEEWSFAKYNRNDEAIKSFLDQSGSQPIKVPHRQNRAVIFNSNLLHRTDDFSFEPGYVNRRLNVTMLYGQRKR